jgi:hypothetical protein
MKKWMVIAAFIGFSVSAAQAELQQVQMTVFGMD